MTMTDIDRRKAAFALPDSFDDSQFPVTTEKSKIYRITRSKEGE